MSFKTKLKEIDAALAAENQDIAEARERIKSLLGERDAVALEVTNQERQEKRAADVEAGRKWKAEKPEEFATWFAGVQRRNEEAVLEGARLGWWDIDDKGNAVKKVQVFKLSDFAEIKNATLAHVMAKAEIFTSVSQARKNGWNKPLVEGEWTVTKRKIQIKVVA